MKTEVLSDLIIEGVAHIATIYTEEGSKAKRCGRECWAIIQKFEKKYPDDAKVIRWFIEHGEYMHKKP